MSHEIPQTTATYGRQKPRNINDLISTIENTDRELRATFRATTHSLHQESHQAPQTNSEERTIDSAVPEITERQTVH